MILDWYHACEHLWNCANKIYKDTAQAECIESAHKYCVQSRLKQAGMKWSIKNANAVAQLRNSYLSGNWDDIWKKAA